MPCPRGLKWPHNSGNAVLDVKSLRVGYVFDYRIYPKMMIWVAISLILFTLINRKEGHEISLRQRLGIVLHDSEARKTWHSATRFDAVRTNKKY